MKLTRLLCLKGFLWHEALVTEGVEVAPPLSQAAGAPHKKPTLALVPLVADLNVKPE